MFGTKEPKGDRMPLNLKLPIAEDITIYRGDTFEFFFRLRDDEFAPNGSVISSVYRNLTGFVGKAEVRDLNKALLAEFSVTVAAHAVTPGAVLCVLTPTQTRSFPVGGSNAIGTWDVQLTSPAGKVKTYVRGSVYVVDETTI
jgi:hypothetical protein